LVRTKIREMTNDNDGGKTTKAKMVSKRVDPIDLEFPSPRGLLKRSAGLGVT